MIVKARSNKYPIKAYRPKELEVEIQSGYSYDDETFTKALVIDGRYISLDFTWKQIREFTEELAEVIADPDVRARSR